MGDLTEKIKKLKKELSDQSQVLKHFAASDAEKQEKAESEIESSQLHEDQLSTVDHNT